jgi:23S rRNA (cytidine2498-2'-O)-methyltransferase
MSLNSPFLRFVLIFSCAWVTAWRRAGPGGESPAAQVVAVDKAPLDPAIAALPGVSARRASAFALDPAAWRREQGPADWLFSDVIAYPSRLLRLVRTWIDAGAARNIVCTIKFQGETDHVAAEAFAATPGAWLRHVSHNKHELMFARLAA